MTVACDFLIGADGARSAVRESIGATLQGTYGLSRNYNIVFRAPGLAEAHSHGQGTMYWQLNPLAPSLMGPMDKDDVWFFMPTRLPEGFKITAETAPDFIRLSTGLALPFEVLSTDEWVASSLIADRYREGRTWLIGDACHLHPPFGGYGMNMGVADGVDLGWKLAASLQGWAGPALLDSYEIERRAIHEEVIAEAAANHAVLSNDLWSEGLENSDEAGEAFRRTVGAKIVAAKTREFHTLRTVLGGSYKASPVIDGDSFEAEAVAEDIYVPSSRPGCLAPHFWRADGTSIYDALGNGFALVCLPGADPAEIAVAVKAAAERCIPLTVVEITGVEAHDRYAEALTLVRPDQYVAWRGSSGVANMITLAAGHEDHNPRRGRADLEVRPVLFAKHPG